MTMGFNWGSLVSSVLPTIGNIVGGLLSVEKIEDGVLSYSFNSVGGASSEFSSTFYVAQDGYHLFNQSPNDSDIVTMTFPSRGNIGAESIILPGRQAFNVTPLFQANAAADNCQFELTGCSLASNAVKGQSSGIKISASAKNVQVGGPQQSLGAYMDVKVEPQKVTVMPRSGISIDSLAMMSLQSGGQSGMRVIDVAGKEGEVTVNLPEPLIDNDGISIEVTANMSQNSISAMLECQAERLALFEVKDDLAERIKNAPKLNWR